MRARTAREVLAAVRREADVRSAAYRTERALRRARGRVLAGPFLGEIGYELLYWIPFLRRALRAHSIPPDRVTVMTRGGAGLWYRDFAHDALDVLELLEPEQYLHRLEGRRARARDLKQLRRDVFDRELVARARERLGDVTVVHPGLMFTRLRGLWFKDTPPARLAHLLEYAPLVVEPDRDLGLPERYVAVKAYFNECVPGTAENRASFREAIERLARVTDVVLLSTGLVLDDHEEWATTHERVHAVGHLLRPEDNLAVQTRVIAGADGLVATYGGFSYLGPFLGVPTLTLTDVAQTVGVHYDVLRAALPAADYTRARVGDTGAVSAFVERAATR